MAKPQRILYVEMAHGMGGSLVSLHQLLKGLDRRRYEPVGLFYWDNPYVARFQELGIETIVWSGPRQENDSAVPIPLPSAVERPRQWLSKATWMSTAYHRLGLYARFGFQSLPLAWRIQQVIRRYDIDLVHANDLLNCNREVVVAARLAGRHCICHVRAFEQYTPLDRLLGQFVDRFIFISHAIAQDSISQGADPAKGTVIYNALDLDEFLQAFDDGTERSGLGLSPDDAVVGILGRLVPWKGHTIFLQAVAQAAQTVPNLHCLIVGDAAPGDIEFRDQLESLTKELGIEERVHFLGWRSDVPRLLSTMDILVHASLEPEPFGRVLIEGMAAAKPVIASNSGACPEIIQNGVSGILVPPGDAHSLAKAITRLIQNPNRLHTMGVVARHQVEARFSIGEHVQRIQQVYDELLDS